MDDWEFATDEQIKSMHCEHVLCYIKWLFANSPLDMDMFQPVDFDDWRARVDEHLASARDKMLEAIEKAKSLDH